jgi:hypothetical protein
MSYLGLIFLSMPAGRKYFYDKKMVRHPIIGFDVSQNCQEPDLNKSLESQYIHPCNKEKFHCPAS